MIIINRQCGYPLRWRGAILGYAVARNAVDGLDMGLFAGTAVGFALTMLRKESPQ